MNVPVIVIDGVVRLSPEANGGIVVGGSNATAYAAYFSAKAGARAAIHHDCGIGGDEAGVRGLPWADQHGMAMAAVAAESARVGDAADMLTAMTPLARLARPDEIASAALFLASDLSSYVAGIDLPVDGRPYGCLIRFPRD